jgi:hypothetical protein
MGVVLAQRRLESRLPRLDGDFDVLHNLHRLQ